MKNKPESIIILIFYMALVCHGMYFQREWVLLGSLFIALLGASILKDRFWYINRWKENGLRLILAILISMTVFSLAGLLEPAIKKEAYLAALQWVLYAAVFVFSYRLGTKQPARERIINKLITAGILAATVAWIPGMENIWIPSSGLERNRLCSFFGYPNAAGIFFAAMLCLVDARSLKSDRNKIWKTLILVVAMAATGSRAAVSIFLLIYSLFYGKNFVTKVYHRVRRIEFRTSSLSITRFGLAKMIPFIFAGLFIWKWQSVFSEAWKHYFIWPGTSFGERLLYYADGLKIAWRGHLLPQAGGWSLYPLVQQTEYSSTDPHSAIIRVLINQGIMGAGLLILLGAIILKQGINSVFSEEREMKAMARAMACLAAHSILDIDMAFGALGILFWIILGLGTGQYANNINKKQPDSKLIKE